MRHGRSKLRHCNSKHSSGLRNRSRGGRSGYATLHKCKTADYYGTWVNGHRTSPERIAR